MYQALWTGAGAPPEEYVDLVLCRDVFHCTPSELDAQDSARVNGILVALGAENRVHEARSRKRLRRGPMTGGAPRAARKAASRA